MVKKITGVEAWSIVRPFTNLNAFLRRSSSEERVLESPTEVTDTIRRVSSHEDFNSEKHLHILSQLGQDMGHGVVSFLNVQTLCNSRCRCIPLRKWRFTDARYFIICRDAEVFPCTRERMFHQCPRKLHRSRRRAKQRSKRRNSNATPRNCAAANVSVEASRQEGGGRLDERGCTRLQMQKIPVR